MEKPTSGFTFPSALGSSRPVGLKPERPWNDLGPWHRRRGSSQAPASPAGDGAAATGRGWHLESHGVWVLAQGQRRSLEVTIRLFLAPAASSPQVGRGLFREPAGDAAPPGTGQVTHKREALRQAGRVTYRFCSGSLAGTSWGPGECLPTTQLDSRVGEPDTCPLGGLLLRVRARPERCQGLDAPGL